jgi:hydroxymethylglutaryl-CoA lyase
VTTSQSRYPAAVTLREVGPRDGLQVEQPLSPAKRVQLIEAILRAGVTEIEAVSFVSETAVPAMAGAREVLDALPASPGATFSALVPNRRGAELALSCENLGELTATIAASPVYNAHNVGRTIAQSLDEITGVCALGAEAGVEVDGIISCAFGSPYEGDIAVAAVAELAGKLEQAGVARVTLADTTGMATPRRVGEILDAVGEGVGMHFHESRGTGLLNLYAALEAGVTRFDTSIGGLGGSPFAAGAAGNVATEETVALLDDLGIASGIDLEALLGVSRLVESLVGHTLASRVAYAGPRSRLASAD